MREWLVGQGLATDEELVTLEKDIKKQVRDGKKAAWSAFLKPINKDQQEAITLLDNVIATSSNGAFITPLRNELAENKEPLKSDVLKTARKVLRFTLGEFRELD